MKTIAKRIYIALIILFLYAPIGILMVLSFNESKTRAKWGGFTFKWYIALFQNEEILRALFNTLLIAFTSSLIATVIGTVACIAMTGMKLIASQELTARNTTIVGLSAALGVGVSQASGALAQFPDGFTMIFGKSPVVIATLMAVLLNLILPKEKN